MPASPQPAPETPQPQAAPAPVWRRYGWLALIAVAYLWVFPYFPRIHSANELPRAYLVRAIADDHTFAIDRGVQRWGATADVSPFGGHQYSNKAPGSSFVVVPFYAAISAIAGPPSLAFTIWLCRVIAGIVPALAFLWLLARFVPRFAPDPAVQRLVLAGYAFGSMAMTYALLYYSHQLAAACIGSAWILALDVADRRRRVRAMIAVGLLAGAAPLVDYQAAFAGVPVLVHLIVKLWRWPRREVATAFGLAAAAAALPIGVLLWYHAVCFGGPLRTGYDASQAFAFFHQHGFLGMTTPTWHAFWGSTFSTDNGLFALAPWWLLAIPGGVLLWRRGDRGLALTAAAVAAMFLWFVSSINFWRGGWGVGPRYITAMQPFLVPAVAATLTAARARAWQLAAAGGAVLAGVAVYTLSAATIPYWPDSLADPMAEVTLRLLGDNAAAPNLGGVCGLPGVVGIVPFVAIAFGMVGWALARASSWRVLAAAAAIGLVLVARFELIPHGGTEPDRAYSQTLYPAVTESR